MAMDQEDPGQLLRGVSQGFEPRAQRAFSVATINTRIILRINRALLLTTTTTAGKV